MCHENTTVLFFRVLPISRCLNGQEQLTHHPELPRKRAILTLRVPVGG